MWSAATVFGVAGPLVRVQNAAAHTRMPEMRDQPTPLAGHSILAVGAPARWTDIPDIRTAINCHGKCVPPQHRDTSRPLAPPTRRVRVSDLRAAASTSRGARTVQGWAAHRESKSSIYYLGDQKRYARFIGRRPSKRTEPLSCSPAHGACIAPGVSSSGRGDVGQQTNAAESAALKGLSSQSHRCRAVVVLSMLTNISVHGRPVRRTRVVRT